MERFLNEEAVRNSKARTRRYRRALRILAGLALAFFVLMCLLTRTGNAQTMLYLAMAGAVLSGWGIIALWLFGLEPARAEEKHLAGLAALEPETREGRFFLTGDSFRIPGSVRVRKARLETGEETLSLNVNEKLADRTPPDGSLVRAETARKFITGLEVLEAGGQADRQKPSRWKAFTRGFGRFLLPAVLWTLTALVFTGFVFNQITDTAPKNKIVIYADCEIRNAPELAERLEKELGGAVRMVKIHPFSYAMFDTARLKQADLYIVPDSREETYCEWFAGEDALTVRDPAAGTAAAADHFLYEPEETYRIRTGSASVHLEDGLARRAAELLAAMTGGEKEE